MPDKTWTRAQCSLAADLADWAEYSGESLQGGLAILPMSMAEVSARTGRDRNCGTVYAHARALGGAVKPAPGRSGLLVDIPALRSIAASKRYRIEHHHTGPGRAEMRPVFNNLPPYARDRAAGDADAAENPVAVELLGLVRDLVGLTQRVVDLIPLQSIDLAAVNELRAVADTIQSVADGPRDSRMVRENVADGPRIADSPDRREGESSLDKYPGQTLSHSLNSPREVRDKEPSRIADRHVADRGTAEPSRSVEKLQELLAPLTELARRNNMVGITNLGTPAAVLASYDDDQIRHAVRQTAALVRSGSVTKSPVGWLITQAQNGNAALFTAPTASARVEVGAKEDDAGDHDTEADAAVSALEAQAGGSEELAELDRLLEGEVDPLIMAKPRNRHVARVVKWRQLHPLVTDQPRRPRVERPPDDAPLDFEWSRSAS